MDTPSGPPVDQGTRERLTRRGLRLEYATIAWNAAEFFITVGLGIAARSLALVAFGLDTLIELFASSVVVWHLRGEEISHRERAARALRLVGVAFFALAAVLAVAAGAVLLAGHEPAESPLGIGYLAATALVMVTLAWLKRRTGLRLGSEPLVSESAMSFLDAALAAAILVALALNAVAGWWWADGLATLVVAAFALREGIENHREAAEMAALPAD